MMRNDWMHDAMQYRDLDRAVQKQVEQEMRVDRVRALVDDRYGSLALDDTEVKLLATLMLEEAIRELEAMVAERSELKRDSATYR